MTSAPAPSGPLKFSVVVSSGEIDLILVPLTALRHVPADQVQRILITDHADGDPISVELELDGVRYSRDENTPEIIEGEAVYWRLPDGFDAITAVADSVHRGILVDDRFWEAAA